jgi:hypothetical protein
MSAARYNLVIDQGSDFGLSFTISEDGSAKNLTGYSARSQMRPSKNSATLSAAFVCAIPNPEDGVINMSLANATSSAMAAGTFVWDLEIFTASDVIVTRLLQGSVNLNREVTR